MKKALPVLFFAAAAIFAAGAVMEVLTGHWGRFALGIGQALLWAALGFSLRQSQKRR